MVPGWDHTLRRKKITYILQTNEVMQQYRLADAKPVGSSQPVGADLLQPSVPVSGALVFLHAKALCSGRFARDTLEANVFEHVDLRGSTRALKQIACSVHGGQLQVEVEGVAGFLVEAFHSASKEASWVGL